MSSLILIAGFVVLGISLIAGYATLRLARANPASYDANQVTTGDFWTAARGAILPVSNPATDFQVNHFVEAIVDADGNCVGWRRAGSLSDEAVDQVLARTF